MADLSPQGDGKRRQRLKGGFRTKVDAERALADLLVALEKGTAVDPSRQSLAGYLDDWLDAVAPSLRPTTGELYRGAVRNWIAPRIGGLPLQSVTPCSTRPRTASSTPMASPTTTSSVVPEDGLHSWPSGSSGSGRPADVVSRAGSAPGHAPPKRRFHGVAVAL